MCIGINTNNTHRLQASSGRDTFCISRCPLAGRRPGEHRECLLEMAFLTSSFWLWLTVIKQLELSDNNGQHCGVCVSVGVPEHRREWQMRGDDPSCLQRTVPSSREFPRLHHSILGSLSSIVDFLKYPVPCVDSSLWTPYESSPLVVSSVSFLFPRSLSIPFF